MWLNDGTKIDFDLSDQWKRVNRKKTGVPAALIAPPIRQYLKATYPNEAVFKLSLKTYGYKIFKTREEFVRGIRDLYLNELIPLVKQGLSAAVYTQVSDVEDETNGMLTFDRRVMKLSPEEFKDITDAIKNIQEAIC